MKPLTEQDLLARGPLRRLGARVEAFASIDSTNRELLRRAGDLPDGAIAWAEHQTAGRGRFGRRWESPRGASILLSVLLHEPHDGLLAANVTAAAALAACDAIERTCDCRPSVRWPNDLVIGDRKLGGVLAETTRLAENGGRAVVIGVGINCYQHAGHFAADLRSAATSLDLETAQPVLRCDVAAELVRQMDERVSARIDAACVRAWCAELQGRCNVDRPVTLTEDCRQNTGRIFEIAPGGDVVLALDNGERRRFGPAATTHRG